MDNGQNNNASDEQVITISSVSKAFGSRLVLKNIELRITRGQGVCICGINGAGKSTLLRIISGLLRPSRGTVSLCGIDVGENPEQSRTQLGVISHKSMLYPDLTLSENLLFIARLYGVKGRHDRVRELLNDVGLWSFRYDKASVLSRGMLQRLAIARAIVHRPAVLLADEPFTGLDTKSCRHLIEVLGKFRRQGGTLVMTSHDTRLALECCGRVAVLDEHSFIFDALSSQIDSELFVEDYLSYAKERA
jgi:heme exporter protein A